MYLWLAGDLIEGKFNLMHIRLDAVKTFQDKLRDYHSYR